MIIFITFLVSTFTEQDQVDTRDSRGGQGDARVDTRDSRGGDPRVDTRDPRAGGNSLSKSERVQACKKQYGKKRKNKAAKQACIAAAKGQ
jgi:hypothetical protein